MTIYEYVAAKNPIGAKTVLNSFGEKAVPRPDILARQLANSVNKHGKEALFRIASVHPDLNLVTEYNKVANPIKKEDCGCKEETESVFSSADGQELKKAVEDLSKKQDNPTPAPTPEKSNDKTELMIIGAVAVIALALITKK